MDYHLPMITPKKIGKKLRKARKVLKLRQIDVAKAVGINANFYAKVERDEVTPSLKVFAKIVKILKLEGSDILSILT